MLKRRIYGHKEGKLPMILVRNREKNLSHLEK